MSVQVHLRKLEYHGNVRFPPPHPRNLIQQVELLYILDSLHVSEIFQAFLLLFIEMHLYNAVSSYLMSRHFPGHSSKILY